MKAKLINFSTQYKIVSNSGSYGDFMGLKQLGLDITTGDDYDYIIFSLSNIVMAGGTLGKASLDGLKELKRANENNIPVICLFLDFKTYTKKLERNSTIRKKYPEIIELYELEDYRDNWFLFHYCRDEEKFKKYIEKIKLGVRFKPENVQYLNNESFWFYDKKEVKDSNRRVCYVGNGRGGARNKFLEKFSGVDIYGRWKEQQTSELPQHTFNGVIKQTEVHNTLNDYFGQLITYDTIGIDYQVDITRLVYTIAAGSLPIIDSKLKYLGLPDRFDWLFVSNQEDLDKIISITKEHRKNTILELQSYFSNSINIENEKNKFITLVENYG